MLGARLRPFGVTTANATRATRARVIWLSVVAAVGLGKAEAQDEEPAEEIRKLLGYLKENQGQVKYGSLRRKGYPIGSGGIESAICGWGALETVGTWSGLTRRWGSDGPSLA